MLCLTRKDGETAEIHVAGSEPVVIKTKIVGNRVKLCIDAPPEMKIYRGEIAPGSGIDNSDEPEVTNTHTEQPAAA